MNHSGYNSLCKSHRSCKHHFHYSSRTAFIQHSYNSLATCLHRDFRIHTVICNSSSIAIQLIDIHQHSKIKVNYSSHTTLLQLQRDWLSDTIARFTMSFLEEEDSQSEYNSLADVLQLSCNHITVVRQCVYICFHTCQHRDFRVYISSVSYAILQWSYSDHTTLTQLQRSYLHNVG